MGPGAGHAQRQTHQRLLKAINPTFVMFDDKGKFTPLG